MIIGWTRGLTTHVIKYDSISPTILEALIYWLGSALGLPKGYIIPEVSEEHRTEIDSPCTLYDVIDFTNDDFSEYHIALALSSIK